MENRGVYSGHVCTENFEVLAKATVAGKGSAEHPIVVLPESLELPEVFDDPEAIRQYAEQVVYELFGV
jgi:hypothetical protein